MKRLRRLWNRYNPRRKYLDCDEDLVILMSQLGYIELYRGEWFFTESGIETIREGISVLQKEHDADVRS